MKLAQPHVEIFKTNVDCETTAKYLVERLSSMFPLYQINFDLDDCDKILRVASQGASINITLILDQMKAMDFEAICLE